MRKAIIIILGLVWTSAILLARTPEEAALIAGQFFSHTHMTPAQRVQRAASSTGTDASVKLAYTQYYTDNATPAVFIFNNQDSNSFVLVSAENEARAVLGYSDQERFDEARIPNNMQFWLQMYADEMARYQANKSLLRTGQVSLPRAKQAAQTTYPNITPILRDVTWGQEKPYNDLCPTVDGERCVTGCVATAIGQIMYVHKYPTQGIGKKAYTSETYKLYLSADFGATTYDWANMLPYYENNYSTTQANAVATLLYHIGVAAEMDYDPDGSGAVSAYSLANLCTYFGYDKGINTLLKDYMQEEDILTAIASDLEQGRPVYISGATKNQEGHAFVCDGMQSNGYLHINWGWEGMSNGYFALSALDPEQQGTGGSTGALAFTEYVDIYTGIQPDQGGTAKPLVTAKKLTLTSSNEISRNAKVEIKLDEFTSSGIATAAGTLGYYIYNTDGDLIKTLAIGTFELETGYYYREPITISNAIPISIANGNYELEVGYTDHNGQIHPILVKNKGVVRIPMVVTSSTITFGSTGTNNNPNNHAAFTGIDISNIDGSNSWQIDLYSSYFWSDYESDDEVIIRCTVNSSSSTSVIGTYILDATNSKEVGTINTDVFYAIGYYQACYQYTPRSLHITIAEGTDGALQVQYYIEVNNMVESKTVSISNPEWYQYTSSQNIYMYYHEYITYDLAATMPTSQAMSIAKSLSHSDWTEMSYFVSGTISQVSSSKEDIALDKSANFYIADDGTSNDQLFCTATKWLNNTDFETGKEIKAGDKVVILCQLQNQGEQPSAKGYIYQHTAGLPTRVEDIPFQQGNTIYDIMGRKWKSTDHLPAGIYIVNGQVMRL